MLGDRTIDENAQAAGRLMTAEPVKAHIWVTQTQSERGIAFAAKDVPQLMRDYARLVVLANTEPGEAGLVAAEILGQVDEKLDRWEGVQRQPGHWRVDMLFGVQVPKAPEVVVKYTFKDAAEAAKFEALLKEKGESLGDT